MTEEEKHERFLLLLFDGTNFTAWKYRMRVLLEEHELILCVEAEAATLPELQDEAGDGNDVKAAKLTRRTKRAKKDKRCKSILVSRIHDSQLEYVQEKTTPKEIWDALVCVFERKSIASRMHLKRQMLSLRLESGSLQEHFLRFDRLVREYRGTGAVIEELDVICHLLLTLGPAYSTVVTALETMPEENLNLEFVKCRLLDEEIKQRGGESLGFSSAKLEVAAFAGSKKKTEKKKKKMPLRCFGCQEEGHKVSDCSKNKQKKSANVSKHQSKANLADRDEVVFVTTTVSDDRDDRCSVQWFVDSGCSDHMAKDKELFDELVPLPKPVEIAVAKNGQSIVAHYSGTVRLQSVVNGKCIPCTVTNVLYVPSLRFNLFSVVNVEKKGMRVVFGNGRVSIYNGSEIVATGARRGKLYELDLFKIEDCDSGASAFACGRITKELELWHRRFGHLNLKQLEQLITLKKLQT